MQGFWSYAFITTFSQVIWIKFKRNANAQLWLSKMICLNLYQIHDPPMISCKRWAKWAHSSSVRYKKYQITALLLIFIWPSDYFQSFNTFYWKCVKPAFNSMGGLVKWSWLLLNLDEISRLFNRNFKIESYVLKLSIVLASQHLACCRRQSVKCECVYMY